MIASVVDRWISVLQIGREQLLQEFGEYIFQWQLQLHDALLIRFEPKYTEYIVETLIPWSIKEVPVVPYTLEGQPILSRGPYYLGTDTELSLSWGEPLTKAQCKKLGVPLKYGKG